MITVTVMRSSLVRPALARAALAGAALAATTLSLAAGAATASGAGASTPGVVHVVAAENFWGNITSQLGGQDVAVTSLITNPNADPHLFETDAADAATLAQAQVVVENGAGYDTWMSSLLSADGGSPRIVTAATVLHITGSDPNPHLWYDIPRVPTVAAAIAAALTKAAPRDAATFKANLATFDASLAPLDCDTGHHQGALPQRAGRLHRAGAGLRAGRRRPRRQDPDRLRPGHRGRRRPRPGGHAGDAEAARRPRHQRAALQRADRHTGHGPDARPGPSSTASRWSASPRRCRPAPAPTSSGSSHS